MNREDIIRMGQEVYLCDKEGRDDNSIIIVGHLEKFAALVASAERERLAKLFDERDKDIGWYDPGEPAEIIRGQA